MIQLLIYGAMALAVLGAVYGVDKSRQNIGANKVRAEYAPVIEQCKAIWNEKPADCAKAIRDAITGRDTCLAANKSLGGQIDTMIATHNAEVEAANAEYERLKAAKVAAKTAIQPQLDRLAMEKFDLIVAAGKQGLTCEQMDAALLDMAKRRQRDFGPAKTTQEAPAGEVRIVAPPSPRNPLQVPK